MKVRLIEEGIINQVDEENLSDQSVLESFYVMRQLLALIESLKVGFIMVEPHLNGQVFSEKFDIYFQRNMYEEVK